MDFGTLLKTFREEAGLARTDLAEQAGLDIATINRLESGKVLQPRRSTVQRLVKTLGWADDDPRTARLLRVAGQKRPQKARFASPSDGSHEPPLVLAHTHRWGIGHPEVSPECPVSMLSPLGNMREPMLLRTTEDVLGAQIQLLTELPENQPAGMSHEILMAFQGEESLFDFAPGFRSCWGRALRGAIDSSWDIIDLRRLKEGINKQSRMLIDMLQLVGGRGSYLPLSLPDMPVLAPTYDLLIVPGRGRLLLFSTAHEDRADAAQFFPDGQYLRAWQAHFELLRSRSEGTPLLSAYPRFSRAFPIGLAFDMELTLAEELEGDRFVAKDGLSTLTVPISVNEERARTLLLEEEEERASLVRMLLTNQRRRQLEFRRQVERWHFRDICPIGAIHRLVRTGHYADDDWLEALTKKQPLTGEQRAAHIRDVIHRLERFSNYELALIDDDRAREIGLLPDPENGINYRTFWEVKANRALLIEVWEAPVEAIPPTQSELDIQIREPSTIDECRRYFLSLWARFAPSKPEVISFLKDRLSEIPQQ